MEGSIKDCSPFEYFDVPSGEHIYLGPQNYYTLRNNCYTNIITSKIIEKNKMSQIENKFVSSIQNAKINNTSKNSRSTTTNQKMISKSKYFERLNDFPDNIHGTCGWTALSIVLGYVDTFHNGNMIDDKWIIGKETGGNLPGLPNGMDKMPGVLHGFDDLLRNNLTGSTSWEVYDATYKYIESRPELLNIASFKLSSCYIPFLSYAKGFIDRDNPCILFGSYDYDSYSIQNHAIVAYGYKNDMFCTHFGYDGAYKSGWVNNCFIR